MKRLLAALVSACIPFLSAPLPADAATPAQIAETAIPSIVRIEVGDGVGTGFAVADGGRIITNLHVIRGAKAATIVTADGRRDDGVEVLAVDLPHDLALIRVSALALPPLRLGDSSTARPGQHVVAIGHPLGFGNTVSDGLISAIRDLAPSQKTHLQISAPISPGSSGGPLFNDDGEVIGLSTLVVNGGQNLNFAVPINAISALLVRTRGTPIAEFSGWGSNGRSVPRHADSLLENCPDSDLNSLVELIGKAIESGASLFNQGHVEACYRIYAGAALDADRRIAACPGPRGALADGLRRAEKLPDWSAKAWAMRDAFDGVTELAARRAAAATVPPAADPRQPRHELSLLDGCKDADIGSIRSEIESAIAVGASLYNNGNVEACYRIYQGAVDGLDRAPLACPAAIEALRTGSANAEKVESWKEKAWALRFAFDGMLDIIARRAADKP